MHYGQCKQFSQTRMNSVNWFESVTSQKEEIHSFIQKQGIHSLQLDKTEQLVHYSKPFSVTDKRKS